jgi:hypothetical protein
MNANLLNECKNQYANACREVFPGATKPLTLSVLTRLLDLEIQEQVMKRNKNRAFCNLYPSVVGTTSNHVVISVVNVRFFYFSCDRRRFSIDWMRPNLHRVRISSSNSILNASCGVNS